MENTLVYDELKRNVTVDEFWTPRGAAKAVINLIPESITETADTIRVLDPGANARGIFGKCVRERWPYALVTGIELLKCPKPEGYDHWFTQDYLEFSGTDYDVVVGNPPYSDYRSGKRKTVVDDWVKHSLHLLRPGGYLLFVLRTNFKLGINRYKSGGVHCDYGYLDEIPICPRPNFYAEDDRSNASGDSPPHDYSVYIWQKDNYKVHKYLAWK